MPELPEIEGLVAFLGDRLTGATFVQIEIAAISAIKTADPPVQVLLDRTITEVGRSGKFVWLKTADPLAADDSTDEVYLATHLSRAGWVRWHDDPPKAPVRMGRGPLAARFTFVGDGGAIVGALDLTEAGTQKRLSIQVARRLTDITGIARLGPDPLADTFTEEVFSGILRAAGQRHLKTLLRDQSTIAGVGNAYSDEILHAAKLSPAAPSDSLDEAGSSRLYRTLRSVLGDAVAASRGLPPTRLKDNKRTTMRVHGHTGRPCPVCGDTVREVATADSSYQYCPTCQTGGKPLADRRMSRLLK